MLTACEAHHKHAWIDDKHRGFEHTQTHKQTDGLTLLHVNVLYPCYAVKKLNPYNMTALYGDINFDTFTSYMSKQGIEFLCT